MGPRASGIPFLPAYHGARSAAGEEEAEAHRLRCGARRVGGGYDIDGAAWAEEGGVTRLLQRSPTLVYY